METHMEELSGRGLAAPGMWISSASPFSVSAGFSYPEALQTLPLGFYGDFSA